MVFITVCEGAAQHYIKEERMMGVTTSSSAETENLWRTAFSLGPRIAPIHCKEFWLHSISPFLYLPMVLVPLSFPAPLCSLSLPQGWSQPEQSHSLEWPWQLHSSSLAKGGPLYGFIQPTPVTAAVETRAKCDQPECEVQDPRSLILMLHPHAAGTGVMACIVFSLILKHRNTHRREELYTW